MSAGVEALKLPLAQTAYLPNPNRKGSGDKTAGSIILLAEELASLKDEVSRNLIEIKLEVHELPQKFRLASNLVETR